MTNEPSLYSRFLGSIMGMAVGDALGAPWEGMPATAIWYDFGGADKIIASPPVEELVYTDDTQMMIAIAETLIECGRVDQDVLCGWFARLYDPQRGYGPGARKILEAVRAGREWKGLATSVFPDGSLGNGAAMRVAPVGLLFHRDLDAVLEQAVLSAQPTHAHPVGQDGAQLLAVAVAIACRGGRFDRKQFYEELIVRAATEEFRDQLEAAARLSPSDSIGFLGHDLEAHRSVPTAIACFTMSPSSYTGTIGSAIALGGDVDTVAAMAGAISGAYLGIDAVPKHLVVMLEDGEWGRRYLERLAGRLFDTFGKQVARLAST